jgi:hypothetical protein
MKEIGKKAFFLKLNLATVFPHAIEKPNNLELKELQPP